MLQYCQSRDRQNKIMLLMIWSLCRCTVSYCYYELSEILLTSLKFQTLRMRDSLHSLMLDTVLQSVPSLFVCVCVCVSGREMS